MYQVPGILLKSALSCVLYILVKQKQYISLLPLSLIMGCSSSKPEDDKDSAGTGLGGPIGDAAEEV